MYPQEEVTQLADSDVRPTLKIVIRELSELGMLKPDKKKTSPLDIPPDIQADPLSFEQHREQENDLYWE